MSNLRHMFISTALSELVLLPLHTKKNQIKKGLKTQMFPDLFI